MGAAGENLGGEGRLTRGVMTIGGQQLADPIVIIDFRVRPPFRSFLDGWLYRPRQESDPRLMPPWLVGAEPSRSFAQRSMPAFIEELDEAGIDKAVIMGRKAPPPFGCVPNSDVATLVKSYPGRFVGFGALGGGMKSAASEIDEVIDLGLVGVAMDNGYWQVHDDDESNFPAYERLEREGLILSLTNSIVIGPDLSYCSPLHIERVALRFPALRIVVPHAAWPWTTQMCGVAFKCRNVHLVPDIYMHLPGIPGSDDYLRAANSFLSYRMIYASSYPIRPIGQSLRQFQDLAFDSDEIRSRCTGGNAASLLGLGS